MTTLVQAMLEVARLVERVREGTTTGGSTTSLIDTSMSEQAGMFASGTLWVTSGALSGACTPVLTHGLNTLTFATQTAAVVSGVSYAVCKLRKEDIKQAVLLALREMGKILLLNETLLLVAGQEEYTLPTGVSDVRDIEIATNAAAPYDWKQYRTWYERNGKLVFHPDRTPTQAAGNKLRVWYAGDHPDILETGSLLIDLEYVKWSAAVILWRKLIQSTHKDNPIAADMFNEAKLMEAEAKRNRPRIPTYVKLGAW